MQHSQISDTLSLISTYKEPGPQQMLRPGFLCAGGLTFSFSYSFSFKEKLSSGPVNTLYYSLFVHDQGFAATDACVSCGKCQKRCPLDNISMENGRPLWKGNCTHCMACIGGCPAEAIEYKKSSKNRRRYYIMED